MIAFRATLLLRSILSILPGALLPSAADAQTGRSDSSLPIPTAISQTPDSANTGIPVHSWGVDLMVSNGGFGLGTFYRREFSDDFSGFIDFSVSEAKDDREIVLWDPNFQRTYSPGRVNRFLAMPLYLGVQKRLFKDEIVDNFRPYVNGAIGPTLLYVFPDNEEFFNAIGRGHPVYTGGGYIGVGAWFGEERSSILGLNIRYYYIPYPGGLTSLENETMDNFGGFFITLNFGSAW